MRRIAVICVLLFSVIQPVLAQTGGQFCVRSFEDRNGNGTLDAGEPLLTQAVAADLLNAEGVVVASALLADSPTAAQGVICFQYLEPGDYSLSITSADYSATTANTFSAAIAEATLPTVVTYGAQRLSAAPAGDTQASGNSGGLALGADFLPRVVISTLGSLLVMAGMVVLGVLIYLLFLRSKQPATAYAYPDTPPEYQTFARPAPPTTGSMAPVVEPPLTADDTDQVRPIE